MSFTKLRHFIANDVKFKEISCFICFQKVLKSDVILSTNDFTFKKWVV